MTPVIHYPPWYLHVCGALFAVAMAGFALRSRMVRRRVFPAPPSRILFRDRMASGAAVDPFWRGLLGASRCLELIVTPEELWVRLSWPFCIVWCGDEYGLMLRSRVDRISSLRERRRLMLRGLELELEDERGLYRRLLVVPRKPQAFLAALREAGCHASLGS